MKFTKLRDAFEKKAKEKGLIVKRVSCEYPQLTNDLKGARNVLKKGK